MRLFDDKIPGEVSENSRINLVKTGSDNQKKAMTKWFYDL